MSQKSFVMESNRYISSILRSLLIILIFTFVTGCHAPVKKGIYDITSYGAVSGSGVVTTSLQNAVDACHENGGGTVQIPPGEFVSGTIVLKNNVNLELAEGAVLKGSTDTSDYIVNGIHHGLIYAQNVKNVSITGKGTINGNGTYFMDPGRMHIGNDFGREYTRQGENFMPEGKKFEDGPVAYDYRPGMMIVFLSSENIRLEEVTLKDSPEWTIRFGECDGVLVAGISIYNNLMVPNSDGIHCTASRNIRISDCDIRAGDDAIIVTGFPNTIGVSGTDEARDKGLAEQATGNTSGFAENVTVTNCVLQSRSAGIRVGYGSVPIRNCTFDNLVIYGSNRGIGIFARDNADIKNIQFSNIIIRTRIHSGHWWGNGEPIHVSSIPQNKNVSAGRIGNIRFENISAESETGMVIYSYEKEHIQDIFMKNIKLAVVPGKYTMDYGGNIDLRPAFDKEHSIFKRDLPGLLVYNTNHINIEDFDLSWVGSLPEFYTNGVEAEGSDNVFIDRFFGTEAHRDPGNAAIKIQNGKSVNISDSFAGEGTGIFVFTRNIRGMNTIQNLHAENAKVAIKH